MHAPRSRPGAQWGSSQRVVAAALVAFGRELADAGAAQFGDAFSDDADADRLVKERPEAFLIGVLFTQGIPAERAWRGPAELERRLGHLDLERLAARPEEVRKAFQRPPMLHRFKETLPRWVSAAARRILSEYDGDASRIWAPGSHVLQVIERLSAFEGIGRKKAAMAVELLARHFGAEFVGTEHGQVAYDVHVRRVFLRSGLIGRDTPGEVARAAALACPEAPATLDLPAWLIGRETCRPKAPACDRCRLGHVCPRLVHLGVEGVGVRRSARAADYSAERKSRPERNFG